MKFDIVDLDAFCLFFSVAGTLILTLLHQQLIVNPKLALRHAWKLCFYYYLADYVGFKNSPPIRYQNINIFYDVDKKLVAAVFYAFGPPTNTSSRLNRNLLQFFNICFLLGVYFSLCDIQLKQIWIKNLRISVVHYFVEELINQRKIFPNRAFIKFFVAEISFAYQHKIIKKLDDECRINISFRRSHQSNIIMCSMDEADAVEADDRRLFRRFSRHNFIAKIHNFLTAYVVAEASVNEDITLLIY